MDISNPRNIDTELGKEDAITVYDLTTLGKIVGGGLPVGVFGGREDIMENVSPSGKFYQQGTLDAV